MSGEATVVTDGLIDFVAEKLAFSVRKYVLKREVSIILYGEKQKSIESIGAGGLVVKTTINSGEPVKLISIKSFEVLCKKGREVLRERANCGSEIAREESIGFYENIISDRNNYVGARIKARANLDKILLVADHSGFANPIPIAGTISHQLDLSTLTKEEKIALLKMKRASNAKRQSGQ